MSKKNLCSVLVSSCDAYEDVWYPFFYFLKKNWSDCPYPIYLSTETKKYSSEFFNVNVLNCPNANKHEWSYRLKKALKKIKSKYVILLLEDFFMLSQVNQAELERCIQHMEKNKDVVNFCFEKTAYKYRDLIDDNRFSGYCRRGYKGQYWANCQAGIWKRNDLIKFIYSKENAWQFEIFGTSRIKLYGKAFYTLKDDAKPIFDYKWSMEDGIGVFQGRWMPKTIDLFEEEDLQIDYEKLGIIREMPNKFPEIIPPKKSAKEKFQFLLHGREGKPYTSVADGLKIMVLHPRMFLNDLKYKLKYIKDEKMRV